MTQRHRGVVELQLHLFLILELDKGEWSASRAGRFTPRGKSRRCWLNRRLGGPHIRLFNKIVNAPLYFYQQMAIIKLLYNYICENVFVCSAGKINTLYKSRCDTIPGRYWLSARLQNLEVTTQTVMAQKPSNCSDTERSPALNSNMKCISPPNLTNLLVTQTDYCNQ